jgi:hypothetical protein
MKAEQSPTVSVALDHISQVKALLDDLAPHGIALYVHIYHAPAFGSFQVELGLPLQRIQFTWEGRDSTLAVACQTLADPLGNTGWVHDAFISVPNRADVYAEIASEAYRILMT